MGNKNIMKWFLEQFKLEREDLQQDLQSLDLNLHECRIGDFACGWGYTSLGLMCETQCKECVGVDLFEEDPVLEVPSLQAIQKLFENLKSTKLGEQNLLQGNGVLREIRRFLNDDRDINFQVGDIVKGRNLPINLDFVYCKKLLQNILEGGGYPNEFEGEEGVKEAIKHIAASVKDGGQVCLVEPAGQNFRVYLEREGLKIIRQCRIQRHEIIGVERNKLYKANYTVYHYSKG